MGKINCGIRKVNKRFRIPLTTFLKANDIKEGDSVRVWIEKVDEND
jgi:hypothetical protein